MDMATKLKIIQNIEKSVIYNIVIWRYEAWFRDVSYGVYKEVPFIIIWTNYEPELIPKPVKSEMYAGLTPIFRLYNKADFEKYNRMPTARQLLFPGSYDFNEIDPFSGNVVPSLGTEKLKVKDPKVKTVDSFNGNIISSLDIENSKVKKLKVKTVDQLSFFELCKCLLLQVIKKVKP